jgi:2-desacetyl-2-hydroxyethyl bacteriochlorophyllide A dehydrogenase
MISPIDKEPVTLRRWKMAIASRRFAKTFFLVAPRRIVCPEEQIPLLGAADILVRTDASAVSVGTELAHYRGRTSANREYPFVPGYENVGTVIDVGAGKSTRSLLNKRVVCSLGHRMFGVMEANRCVVVPEDIGSDEALLVILLADILGAIDKVNFNHVRNPRFLITGGGALGLLSLFVLVAKGFTAVDIVEPRPDRQVLARKFGARSVIAPEAAGHLDANYYFGLECSDSPSAFALLQEKIRWGGQISVIADGNYEPHALTQDFHRKSLAVFGCNTPARLTEVSPWYFDKLRQGFGRGLSALYQHAIQFSEIPRLFEELDREVIKPVKARVLYPSLD